MKASTQHGLIGAAIGAGVLGLGLYLWKKHKAASQHPGYALPTRQHQHHLQDDHHGRHHHHHERGEYRGEQ